MLREEWDALGLISYHGAPWDHGSTTWYADLGPDDIVKIRDLLRDAGRALEDLLADTTVADQAASVREHYTKVCKCEWEDDELTRTTTNRACSIHGAVPDPLDALIGERDGYRDALALIAHGGYGDASMKAKAALSASESSRARPCPHPEKCSADGCRDLCDEAVTSRRP